MYGPWVAPIQPVVNLHSPSLCSIRDLLEPELANTAAQRELQAKFFFCHLQLHVSETVAALMENFAQGLSRGYCEKFQVYCSLVSRSGASRTFSEMEMKGTDLQLK